MRGSADLLRRIEQPSALGECSYISIECKLASKPKTTFLVQASAYCELLIPLIGSLPDQFDLYLGGGGFQRYNTYQFWAWYQHLRQRFSAFQERFDPILQWLRLGMAASQIHEDHSSFDHADANELPY